MSKNDLTASININAGGNFGVKMRQNEQRWLRFSKTGERQMNMLRRSMYSLGSGIDRIGNRYTAALAGAASAYVSTRAVMQSGKLDKQLIQIRQTAGATAEMTAVLRKELHAMSTETGQSFDSLLGGFNNLIQAGQTWEQALLTIKAINPAMAVTGAQAEILTAALSVAAEAFDFDLSQPKIAAEILDQMTVAGRLGNAELEDLSGIFARVGVNSKAANLSFSDTLGFIERLSLIERSPERLATLADSTLRLFTNKNYMDKAAKVTGVSFYDAEGQRRAAFDVLDDIAAKFKTLKTDAQKDKALSAAFGGVDLDTLKGLRTLLTGSAISDARAMSNDIAASTGTIGNDLEDALKNSVDQVARLKSALSDAADEFAQPVNDAIENAVKYLLDEKKLSGKELLMGGAGAAAAGVGMLKGSSHLLKRFGGVGVGVATGKALEEVTGVQPVYVVNMPGSGMDGMLGGKSGKGGKAGKGFQRAAKLGKFQSARAMSSLSMIPKLGLAATGVAGLAVGGAGAAGYGAGKLIYDNALEGTDFADKLGRSIAQALAFMGSDNAQSALNAENKSSLQIEIIDGKAKVKSIQSNNMDINVDTGSTVGGM